MQSARAAIMKRWPSTTVRARCQFGVRTTALSVVMMASWVSGAFAIDGPTSSAAEAQTLAQRYVELAINRAALKAQQKQASQDVDRLAARALDAAQFDGFSELDAETRLTLGEILFANTRPLEEHLGNQLRDVNEKLEALKATWIDVRTQRNQLIIELAEAEAGQRAGGRVAAFFSMENRWFWFWGLFAFATLVALAMHERRHEYRRRLNGARARAMGLDRLLRIAAIVLLVLTVGIFLFGDRVYNTLLALGGAGSESPLETLRQENEALAEEVDDLQQTSEDLVQRAKTARDNWRRTVSAPHDQITAKWDSIYDRTVTTAIKMLTVQEATEVLRLAASDLEVLRQKRVDQRAAIEARQRFQAWAQSVVGLLLLGVAVGGTSLFVRGLSRRRQEIRRTCPMCLGQDKLEVQDNVLHCQNVISAGGFDEECGFEFHPLYQDMLKLCIPTLGHPQAGKTHWLAMVYRQLNLGVYQSQIKFAKVKSRASEDFDMIVDEIINQRMNPSRTQVQDLPHPLVFNFSDDDRLGRSTVLVNIFDYSGEILNRSLDDPHRQRALDADGYLFFLDPTHPSDDQAKELVDFRADVQLIKKISPGQSLRAPVALCVSKIDLLVGQPFADPHGEGPVGDFYKQLNEIDPGDGRFSLDTIQARSDLVRRMRDTIWPGWKIEDQVDDLFGGRHMFFPLTPVGLSELGETDLSSRVIDPYAILEPLAWLLHMNGYPVLK